MKIFDLVIEQIKSVYPEANRHQKITKKNTEWLTLTLEVPPFGEIMISQEFNLFIKYLNPYSTDHKIFESFFDPRLKFEGYETYIYKDKIHIYKRTLKASNDFEYAIKRANIFIEATKCIEKFVDWNETLNSKE